jgi:cbb3-type cytochrome oxidase subunit 3
LGLLVVLIVVPVILFGTLSRVFVSLCGDSFFAGLNGLNGYNNTTVRERLINPAEGAVLRYEDATNAGDWFAKDAAVMETGAQRAFELTGVKYGVYVMDGDYTGDELYELADALYGEWFGNSSKHLLIMLADVGDGTYAAMDIIGNQARGIYDDEAMSLYFAFLDGYWDDPDNYTESQMFGFAMLNTAERIMTVTPSPFELILPYLIKSAIAFGAIVLLVIIVALLVFASVKRKRAEAERARANAELLRTPVAGLDTDLPDELLLKYSQKKDE